MYYKEQDMPLFTLTVAQFTELHKSLLEDALRSEHLCKTRVTASGDTEKYFNFSQTAAYLGISKPTLSKLRRQGKITCSRISKSRVVFAKSHLDAFVNDSKQF